MDLTVKKLSCIKAHDLAQAAAKRIISCDTLSDMLVNAMNVVCDLIYQNYIDDYDLYFDVKAICMRSKLMPPKMEDIEQAIYFRLNIDDEDEVI